MTAVGHQVQINLGNTVPTEVSYWLRSNNPTDLRTLLVQHSQNGTTWTNAQTHTEATVPNTATFYTTAIPSTANFIRFRMTVRAASRFKKRKIEITCWGALFWLSIQ